MMLIFTSFFLSLSNPKAKKPFFETLIFLLSIITVEPGSVFPKIKEPCSNFPLNSNALIGVDKIKKRLIKSKYF